MNKNEAICGHKDIDWVFNEGMAVMYCTKCNPSEDYNNCYDDYLNRDYFPKPNIPQRD